MALQFEPVSIEHKALVESYTKPWHIRGSEYTFTNIFIWGCGGRIRIAEKDGALFFLLKYEQVPEYMFAPVMRIGGDYEKVLALATEYCLEHDITPYYKGVSGPLTALFEGLLDYTLVEDRANHDYVYAMTDLRDLSGKKFHSKRNHINQFKARYEDYEYVSLTPDMLEECMSVYDQWRDNKHEEDDWGERDSVQLAIDQMHNLGLRGGAIRVGGVLSAFSLGERVDEEMAVIHIEKANAELVGLFTMINQQFVLHELGDMKWINREEDMGLEGLRRAKLSYNPAELLVKYEARYKKLPGLV